MSATLAPPAGSDAGPPTATSISLAVGTAAATSTPSGTSTAPTGAWLWRRLRGPLAVALALVVITGLLGSLHATGQGGQLDPRSYRPAGSHAVAQLLRDRGVPVRLVRDVPQLRDALRPSSTVLVAQPDLLTPDELRELASLSATLVVLDAGPDELAPLAAPVTARGQDDAQVRKPACDLPAAVTAGAATTGGYSYAPAAGAAATGCYARSGAASLLVLARQRLTLLGASDLLRNDELGNEGNAALALGLLGSGSDVLWLLPDPAREIATGRRTVRDLLPDAVPLVALQLGIAVLVLALARARRLGRVVTEPLPVTVRAAETVEGRGRLYRAAAARDVAAESLRAAARERLRVALGLPSGADGQALTHSVAARSGRDPAAVDGLLHGPAPGDDATLVRLADELDGLQLPTEPRPRQEQARP